MSGCTEVLRSGGCGWGGVVEWVKGVGVRLRWDVSRCTEVLGSGGCRWDGGGMGGKVLEWVKVCRAMLECVGCIKVLGSEDVGVVLVK